METTTKARIVDIQRFSTQDGPGIRTTVFFKGCSLNCRWCHNPETIDPRPGVGWTEKDCIRCGLCAAVCPKGAIAPKREDYDRAACIACGACIEECLENALRRLGEELSPQQLFGRLLKDENYYKNSGGGVTFSGGEPLLQADAVAETFALCKNAGIHTALDTAGHVNFAAFQKVLPVTDLVLFDIKMVDGDRHKTYTGADNKTILANLHKLLEMGVPMEVRIPLMSGVNDDEQNIRATAQLINGKSNITKVKLLPYHNMGASKRAMAGLGEAEEFTPPTNEKLTQLAALFDCPVEF
ncbi:MAG: glycyl-radical enzyme activating protein [Christensenellaceae bacterium]|nr:glycyl-radical enzyme activating protein [Christensenellaceae bacterium]